MVLRKGEKIKKILIVKYNTESDIWNIDFKVDIWDIDFKVDISDITFKVDISDITFKVDIWNITFCILRTFLKTSIFI